MYLVLVHDATAKISSGILSGNINQLGHFDQCLNIDDPIKGKYCVAYLQPSVPDQAPYLNYLKSLAQSFEMIKSNFNDVSKINCKQIL